MSQRSTLAALAASSALVTGTLVAAPQAHAAGEYSCRVSSAPTSVKIGTTFKVSYIFYKSSTVKSANWSPSNTNPVMFIRSNTTGTWYEAATNTGATYYVRPGGGVAITFYRGTSSQASGWHALKGVMYRAHNGNTTYLMSGTPCYHKVNFYR